MLENGYIVLSRKICNWRWYQDKNTLCLFIHLILQANYEPHDFRNITVNRGQLVSSYKQLSNELNMSIQSVRTALEHLKSTGEVTIKSYNKYTVFTVNNYDLYQLTNTQTNNQSTINQQATNIQLTTMEERRRKNNKDNKSSSSLTGEKIFSNLLTNEQYSELLKITDKQSLDKYINKIIKWQNQYGKRMNNPYETIRKWISEDNQNKPDSKQKSYDLNGFEEYAMNFSLYDEEEN